MNGGEGEGEKGGEPALVAAGLIHTQCPGGWRDVSGRDLHVRVLSCERVVDGTRWLVVLTPAGEFDYGMALDTPGAAIVEVESGVPGWD